MVLKDQWNLIDIPEKDPHQIKYNKGNIIFLINGAASNISKEKSES